MNYKKALEEAEKRFREITEHTNDPQIIALADSGQADIQDALDTEGNKAGHELLFFAKSARKYGFRITMFVKGVDDARARNMVLRYLKDNCLDESILNGLCNSITKDSVNEQGSGVRINC